MSGSHNLADIYVDVDSPVHRLDPRTKFLTALALVVAVVVTPPTRWQAFALYLLMIIGLILAARLPLRHVLKRSMVVLPFVLVIAVFVPFFKQGQVVASLDIWRWKLSVSDSGLLAFGNAVVKAWLSVLSMIWVSATTTVPTLLRGLQGLGIPKVLVMIVAFMYRYSFILVEDVTRMRHARASRDLGSPRQRQIKTVGNMIGTLLMRSYERGERVYGAMLARGFDGQARTLNQLRLKRQDISFGLVALGYIGVVSALSWTVLA